MKKKGRSIEENLVERFLATLSSKRDLACILLMWDAGLGVDEIRSLTWTHCDLEKRCLHVAKEQPKQARVVYPSKRLHQALWAYAQEIPNQSGWLLPGRNGPITRRAIEQLCAKFRKKHPGLHAFTPKVMQSIGSKRQPGQSLIREDTLTQGRESERNQIQALLEKGCNVILLGPIGIGKSHLIQTLIQDWTASNHPVLYLDDCYEIKQSLIQVLLYLYKNDKKAVQELLQGPYDLKQLYQHLQRSSVVRLTQAIMNMVPRQEYLLVIDQVDTMTPKAIKVLETLKDHFTILTSSRGVPLKKTSFLWNFQQVPIRNLSKEDSLSLIRAISQGIPREDDVFYLNHIYHQSGGNPRMMLELVDRFRKEGSLITNQMIRSTRHSGNRKEYDLSILLVILLAGISGLRYLANELGEPRLKILGGMALLFLIVLRYFFAKSKKK